MPPVELHATIVAEPEYSIPYGPRVCESVALIVNPSDASVAQDAVVRDNAEVPSNGYEKLDIELITLGELQLTDAGPPPPVL